MHYLHMCGPYAKRCWKERWQLLLWHQKTRPVHEGSTCILICFTLSLYDYVMCTQPSLCDPGFVTTEGWSDAPTSAGHWPGCLIWCSGSTLCFCSLQERNLKKTPLIPSSFPSLHLILLCVVILSQRVGRSHCWLRLRDISAHLSGPEPPHSGDPGRMLVRSKWWKHLERQAELLAIPIPSGWFFLLDAMEFVVCGIAAVLKFSRDVISSLMGQKGKSCSYFK